ncbi:MULTISPECIES: KAP family P-loop NTPase fold protein [Bacillus cereus group]|uniref:KAP family P-loop NTPase fold protein n=1 Tax=Bacillus cereus group TaxID=86661 RepID=UPI001364AF5A|nr:MULTISPECIES: P-loop NTPase fold protein [Bacillus cereus group]MEB8943588.1 P-loop NTPase fold protein [Bacillus cereus]
MFDILFYLSSLSLLLLVGIYLVNKLKKAEGDKEKNEFSLHNDDPLQMSEQDALSRKEFAKQLIDPIIKSNGKLTIGIYGPWGSGKSSFFTMMNDYIPKEQLKMNFTPWYFGENTDGIILEFLEHFAEQINKSNYYDTGLEKELAAYANFFKSIQLRPTGATIALGDLFKGFLPEESDIKAIKKVIDNMLIKSDRKIVVFIDDLDRLDREEIITVFKLIRLVCDFPNVVYVLALDEEIVSLALGQVYLKQATEEQAMLKGREYLEKFIQVPIYLPKVDEVKFKQFFIDGLKEILQKHNIKTGFFENIDSIYPVIDITTFRTIRNIKRYLNLVQIFVPILKEEVFVDDLLYLLAIKVTEPSLYDWIRMHPHILYEDDQRYFKDNETINTFKKKYSKYRLVIEELFPAMGNAFGNSSIPKKTKPDLPNRQLTISDKTYFSKYFMYSTPANQISQVELQAFYSLLSKNNEAVEEFDRLCGLYPVKDIFVKMGNDVIIQSDETILLLIDLLKGKYIDSSDPHIRSNIGEYIFKCYLEKRDGVLASSLFKEPSPLQLLIELRSEINYYLDDQPAIDFIDQEVIKTFKKLSLDNILTSILPNRQYSIIGYFVKKEDIEDLRRKKFTEYITDFSKFQKIVSCLYDGKMSDIVFYQKLLENIESETINKYISEFDLNQEMTEDKRMYEQIKEGMRQAIPYIIYALSGAFENSVKQNIEVRMDDNFLKQKQLFLEADLANIEQKKELEELLEKIEQHNKKF